MSVRQRKDVLVARDEIVAVPANRSCEDQSFEMPTGIYVAMASMFAGFVLVMVSSFRGGHMAVAYGVIFAFIAAFFAIPTVFPNMAKSGPKARSWFDFRDNGMATATGHTGAREATTLVLLLPFLLLCFGLAIAIIVRVV